MHSAIPFTETETGEWSSWPLRMDTHVNISERVWPPACHSLCWLRNRWSSRPSGMDAPTHNYLGKGTSNSHLCDLRMFLTIPACRERMSVSSQRFIKDHYLLVPLSLIDDAKCLKESYPDLHRVATRTAGSPVSILPREFTCMPED